MKLFCIIFQLLLVLGVTMQFVRGAVTPAKVDGIEEDLDEDNKPIIVEDVEEREQPQDMNGVPLKKILHL